MDSKPKRALPSSQPAVPIAPRKAGGWSRAVVRARLPPPSPTSLPWEGQEPTTGNSKGSSPRMTVANTYVYVSGCPADEYNGLYTTDAEAPESHGARRRRRRRPAALCRHAPPPGLGLSSHSACSPPRHRSAARSQPAREAPVRWGQRVVPQGQLHPEPGHRQGIVRRSPIIPPPPAPHPHPTRRTPRPSARGSPRSVVPIHNAAAARPPRTRRRPSQSETASGGGAATPGAAEFAATYPPRSLQPVFASERGEFFDSAGVGAGYFLKK